VFHNILVCVDGSVHAQKALDEAIDLAEAGHGRLTVLTSIPRPPYWATSSATAPAVGPLAGQLRHEAETTLSGAVARVPQSIPVTTVLSDRPIREALMERLKTGQHDLLVVGSRGRGALSASVLGSVSHYALNHIGVPVLIIHADRPAHESEAAAESDAQVPARPVGSPA
jgi:nucleotide-binding universal stress UspA family protein